MIRSLWEVYRKSGVGELETHLTTNVIDRRIWPKEILSFVKDEKVGETTVRNKEDDVCLNFVNDYIRQLNDQSDEYRRELRLKTSAVSDYTPNLEDTIENFVQQGLVCLRLEIDCQIAMIHHHYIDELLQRQCLVQNPTDRQVTYVKREREREREREKAYFSFLYC